MNDNEIAKLAMMIHELWPTFEATPNTVPTWRLVLEDADYDACKAAVLELQVAGERFAPTPGMIRKAAMKALGFGGPDVDQAMEEIFGVATRIGYVRGAGYAWSHPAVEAAVRVVGWRTICYEEMGPSLRAQVRMAYESAVARVERQDMSPPSAREALEKARVPRLPALGDLGYVETGFCQSCGGDEFHPRDGCAGELHSRRQRASGSQAELSPGQSDWPEFGNRLEDP